MDMEITPKILKEYIHCLNHMLGTFEGLLSEMEGKKGENPLVLLTELRMLAKSDKWPLAVSEDMRFSEDEVGKLARARAIIEYMEEDFKGKKFLDYGCGDSLVVNELSSICEARGYDIGGDFEEIQKAGPYDIILLYDVLDHCTNETQESLMGKVESLLSPDGVIYVRCHPWTSPHATHMYNQLNRGYLHLVFTPEELVTFGISGVETLRIEKPVLHYRELFKGFKYSENIIMDDVSQFYFDDKIVKKGNLSSSLLSNMKIHFIDYKLWK